MCNVFCLSFVSLKFHLQLFHPDLIVIADVIAGLEFPQLLLIRLPLLVQFDFDFFRLCSVKLQLPLKLIDLCLIVFPHSVTSFQVLFILFPGLLKLFLSHHSVSFQLFFKLHYPHLILFFEVISSVLEKLFMCKGPVQHPSTIPTHPSTLSNLKVVHHFGLEFCRGAVNIRGCGRACGVFSRNRRT